MASPGSTPASTPHESVPPLSPERQPGRGGGGGDTDEDAPALHEHEAAALRASLRRSFSAASPQASLPGEESLEEIMRDVNAHASPERGHSDGASRGALRHWRVPLPPPQPPSCSPAPALP